MYAIQSRAHVRVWQPHIREEREAWQLTAKTARDIIPMYVASLNTQRPSYNKDTESVATSFGELKNYFLCVGPGLVLSST